MTGHRPFSPGDPIDGRILLAILGLLVGAAWVFLKGSGGAPEEKERPDVEDERLGVPAHPPGCPGCKGSGVQLVTVDPGACQSYKTYQWRALTPEFEPVVLDPDDMLLLTTCQAGREGDRPVPDLQLISP